MALAPTSANALETKVMAFLGQGDLAGARRVVRSAPPTIDRAELVATLSQFWDLYWVLDDAQVRLLFTLPVSAFGDSREGRALAIASTHALRGDQAHAHAYADTARIALENNLAAQDDAQLHVLLGTALAYLGRRDEAVRQGRRAVEMQPISKDAFIGPYLQHQLARIYILVGEPEQALDQLEPLLRVPYFLSPAWLTIDPTFEPLRGNPRFQRLVDSTR
jgi:tetratricopeptide (TPR) repeat protein